ncbi:MAG: hypothetical protein LAO04_15705 [Acidobacteriia bacterium]|nr:hypothetical protein [Terriglobia bacterium]
MARLLSLFPVFYSYIIYVLCGTVTLTVIYVIRPRWYATGFWFHELVCVLVEFAVLVEIADHMFQPFPAIRHLGRALTLLISFTFALVYILPAILQRHEPGATLLDFALRASVTKAVILAGLVFTAHRFGLRLGRNVAGLMLGFSIYLGVNVANFAAAQNFGQALYIRILWVMSPIAFTLCLLVWTIALWELAPMPRTDSVRPAPGGNSQALTLELARFNGALSRFLRR